MKLIPSIAFNDFSGSAGNVTARKIGDKTYLSVKTKHSRKKTSSQAEIRCRFADTIRGYNELTDEQRQGWTLLANNTGIYTTSSGATSVTGHNLFVAINSYRQIFGKPLSVDVPSQIFPSSCTNIGEFWLSPERILFTGVALNDNSSDVILFEMYPAQSPVETKSWNKTVIVAVVPATDWGDIDLTEAFLQKFGTPLTIGQMVFVKICRIDSECGYIKWYSMIAFPARETSYLNNADYTPRVKISMDNIVPITNYDQCEHLDYEMSPGSKITSNTISAKVLKGYLAGCEFPHKGLPNIFYSERSFQYARATAEYDYFIQCMEVKIENNSYKKINLTNRAGNFKKHFETFGTYYVTN